MGSCPDTDVDPVSFQVILRECAHSIRSYHAQIKNLFPGLIFAQHKSINIVIINNVIITIR